MRFGHPTFPFGQRTFPSRTRPESRGQETFPAGDATDLTGQFNLPIVSRDFVRIVSWLYLLASELVVTDGV